MRCLQDKMFKTLCRFTGFNILARFGGKHAAPSLRVLPRGDTGWRSAAGLKSFVWCRHGVSKARILRSWKSSMPGGPRWPRKPPEAHRLEFEPAGKLNETIVDHKFLMFQVIFVTSMRCTHDYIFRTPCCFTGSDFFAGCEGEQTEPSLRAISREGPGWLSTAGRKLEWLASLRGDFRFEKSPLHIILWRTTIDRREVRETLLSTCFR